MGHDRRIVPGFDDRSDHGPCQKARFCTWGAYRFNENPITGRHRVERGLGAQRVGLAYGEILRHIDNHHAGCMQAIFQPRNVGARIAQLMHDGDRSHRFAAERGRLIKQGRSVVR